MDTLIDYLAEARVAHQRNDWRASYAAFVRADGLGPMPTDDLNAYSVTAWRLGYENEAVRLAERTFDRLARTDPAAAAMKAAELALLWHAREHHTVLISRIPQLTAEREDPARRFVNLVDEFYDRGVKLLLAADVAQEQLYVGRKLVFEFKRTQSRLIEMQTQEYLARPHRS